MAVYRDYVELEEKLSDLLVCCGGSVSELAKRLDSTEIDGGAQYYFNRVPAFYVVDKTAKVVEGKK